MTPTPTSDTLTLVRLFIAVTLLWPGIALGEPLSVAGEAIEPGERKELALVLSETFSAGDVSIPVSVIRGKEPGPVLCLIAGIHGDELNGVAVVREALRDIVPEGLSGTVIGVPLVNVFGYWNQSRYLPDRRDLNRHFPGRQDGTAAARIAYRLWTEIVVHCTHLIDFHTGSLHRTNLPQVRGDLRRPEVLALARAFGADVLVHSPAQARTLRAVAVEAGIPAILYEGGETFRFERASIDEGVDGVRRTLRALGMRKTGPPPPRRQDVFMRTRWVRAHQGGLVEVLRDLGEWVERDDVVGLVTDPLSNLKGTMKTPWSGRVIGRVLAPMVLPGYAVLHLGVPGGTPGPEDAVADPEAERPE